jgi:exonuclease SbcD
MRFLQTADWHLGRLFHQVHLTDDQAFVVRQVIDIARDARLDAIVIAGDVYDRAVPPPDAVALLDDTLSELLLGLHIPTILVAGNHDSPERLSFGARLLATQGLHVFGAPARDLAPVVLRDEDGPVAFYPAPYAEPALARERLGDPRAVDHETAMRVQVETLLAPHPPVARSVFVGHAYVQGAVGSDSERPLSVGGAGAVEAANFDRFPYVALGHLHRPQNVADSSIRYAGALLKYSFDEVGQDRSVTIVEMDAGANCAIEEIPLVPRHDLRRVEGTLDELLQHRPPAPARDDYIVARLFDRHPVLDPVGRLRAVYPNVLSIERAPDALPGSEGPPRGDRRQLDYEQLFSAFFGDVTGNAPTAEEREVFASVLSSLGRADREVPA